MEFLAQIFSRVRVIQMKNYYGWLTGARRRADERCIFVINSIYQNRHASRADAYLGTDCRKPGGIFVEVMIKILEKKSGAALARKFIEKCCRLCSSFNSHSHEYHHHQRHHHSSIFELPKRNGSRSAPILRHPQSDLSSHLKNAKFWK